MVDAPKPRTIQALENTLGQLRPSQRKFVFSSAPYTALAGGWGSGKSYALCIRALVLSAYYPGNAGLIGRYTAASLEDSTMPSFFEVCPTSWIKSYQKARKKLTLKNGSTIIFRHIHDPNPKRRHITSTNLGWFAIDQLEECEEEHWNTLLGRLRLPRAKKRFAFGALNPAGKDWIYEKFFSELRPFEPGELLHTYPKGQHLGIAVKAEENKKSNGGFVDDNYFEHLRDTMPIEWVRRYVDCSFEDFSGKIYGEYNLTSVHNIEKFDVLQRGWNIGIGIDVGGTPAPWSVMLFSIDPWGNVIAFDEFSRPTVNTREVADWIKFKVPFVDKHRIMTVIDWENKLAMLELGEYGIHCRPAAKQVRPGILRTGGYIHINPKAALPSWYEETQPRHVLEKVIGKGSPRFFIMNHLRYARKCFDRYVWDDNGLKPKKVDDHPCDATRYFLQARPNPSKLKVINYKREELRKKDPLSAREWDAMDKRLELRNQIRKGRLVGSEISLEETPTDKRFPAPELTMAGGKFDWGGED